MADPEPPRNHDDSISEDSQQLAGKKEKSRRPASERLPWPRNPEEGARLTVGSFTQILHSASSD
jgi:hypothetical protein